MTERLDRPTKSRIPEFKNVEEEAAFWDSHDTTDCEDEQTHCLRRQILCRRRPRPAAVPTGRGRAMTALLRRRVMTIKCCKSVLARKA